MIIDKWTLAERCRRYGPLIKGLATSVDGIRLLWALGGNESDFGALAIPRHEPSYCRGGHNFNPTMTKLWGCWAHCSYGFSQIMFSNAYRLGFSLPELFLDVDVQMHATLALLQQPEFHGKDLDEIGKLWNGPKESVQYAADLRKHYNMPLPAAG